MEWKKQGRGKERMEETWHHHPNFLTLHLLSDGVVLITQTPKTQTTLEQHKLTLIYNLQSLSMQSPL